jgi:hypothetical protein
MAWEGSTLDAVVKALTASHSQPGSIRKACETMEDYMLSNKYMHQLLGAPAAAQIA